MKKIAILILSILIASLFVACNQDVTVDAQTYANMEVGTFVLNGQNYATLQAAVDAIGSKAAGDNVIRLTKNASGPGAKIANKDVTIDFQGYTYSFTNVTGLQGVDVTGKDFGLSITSGSDVVLKGMEKIDLNDKTTTDLTMVYVEGKETKLAIESAPKMVVEPDQYVFWAADGATLTIGSTNVSDEASITGKVAATGGASEDSKPTVTVQGATTLAGGVKAESAKVKVTDTAAVTGSIEATQAEVELTGNSAVSGSISTSGSTVTVGDESKVNASLTATESSTVTITSKDNVITTLDKSENSTVITSEDLVVEEVTSEDNTIQTTDNAQIYKDTEKTPSTDVDPDPVPLYAKIGNTLYETFDAALATVTDSTPTTIVLLGEYVATTASGITIGESKDITVDLNGWSVGSSESHVTLNNNGSLTIEDSWAEAVEPSVVYIGSEDYHPGSSSQFTVTGGTYIFNPENPPYYDFVPAWCSVTKDPQKDLWTVAPITGGVAAIGDLKFATLESAIGYASSGDTIKLLKDVTITQQSAQARVPISKSIILDGDNKTVSIDGRGFGVGMNATSPVDVTFKDITINNSSSGARCIDTRGNLNSLTLDKVILSTNEATSGYTQPLTIGGNQATPATIYIKDSTIQTKEDATAYYAIIIFNPVNMTIDNSTLKGWACLYLKEADGSAGSNGSNIKVMNNSNICSSNIYNGVSNAFGAIVFEDSAGSSTVTIENSNINIEANSDQYQAVACYDNGIPGIVELKSGVVMTTSNKELAKIQLNYSAEGEGVIITGGTYDIDPSDYVAEGYVAKPQGTTPETWKVDKASEEDAVAKIVRESETVYYLTLQDAVDYAKDNETIILLKDYENHTGIRVSKSLTLDLDGKVFKVTDTGTDSEHATLVNNLGRNIYVKPEDGATASISVTVKNGTLNAYNADPSITPESYVGAVGTTRVRGLSENIKATLNIENCTLENSHRWGLSIKADQNGVVNVSNSTVHSVGGAGGIEIAGGVGSVESSTFLQKDENTLPGYAHIASSVAASGMGVLDVSNTDFESEAQYAVYVYTSGATININGGSFTGHKNALISQVDRESYPTAESTIYVSSGDFYGGLQTDGGEYAKIILKGGTYDTDPTGYEADGYDVEQIDTSTWKVVPEKEEVSILQNGHPESEAVKMSLASFRNKVNAGNSYAGYTATLLDGVNLNGSDSNQWIPIGTEEHPFRGSFNGDKKSITNLYMNDVTNGEDYALFGVVEDASIENLTVSGNITAKKGAAGIVAKALGNTTITNVTNSVNVSAYNKAGGIICSAYPSYTYDKANNNNVNAITTDRVITLDGCVNTGNITCLGGVSNSTHMIAGAIVGYTGQFGRLVCEDCVNEGTIKSVYSNPKNVSNLGSNVSSLVVGWCANNVNVDDSASENKNGCYITACTNTGTDNLITIGQSQTEETATKRSDIVVGYAAGCGTGAIIYKVYFRLSSSEDFSVVDYATEVYPGLFSN